jgi:hypothetical protein
MICAVLAGSVVCTGVVTPAGAGDWRGHKLPNIPTNFIVGFGSLINAGSRNSTASACIAIPVRVSASFGYIRSWNERREGFTALGLRKAKPGESGVTINGVLYPAEGADGSLFDEREEGYVKVEVPMSQIEAVGWQRLPETGHFWIYVPVRSVAQGGQGVPGEGLPEPDVEHPLHDLWSSGAGSVGADLSLRPAGPAAGRMGLVIHGRYRRHVRRDLRPDRPVLRPADDVRSARRRRSCDDECEPKDTVEPPFTSRPPNEPSAVGARRHYRRVYRPFPNSLRCWHHGDST